MSSATIDLIKEKLTIALKPSKIIVEDESAQHVGHPGAAKGGHYSLEIVSEAFNNKSPLECHRLVYQALGDLMQTHIHALRIKATDY